MPPRTSLRQRQNNAPHSYARLERRMTLLSWLHDLLGYTDTDHLLNDIRPAKEGFDGDGRSYVCRRLCSRGPRLTDQELEHYDDNIRRHLASINEGRATPITLRYFQYLAALYTEIFLDRYHRNPSGLLESLNEHVDKLNSGRAAPDRAERYIATDLKKLALWMATGSGKTLLMHLNYRQFLHYNREPLDNILLVTPNEGLTRQHLDELRLSGIPARRLDLNAGALIAQLPDTILVTDIHKLVTEKSGQGVTIPVGMFEGRNLIFVDEGHKGSGGEARAWRKRREALAQTGFTFEYSATFGEALAAARNDDLVTEYGQAIAFDYSYRFFYNDGYGKDFDVLNLQRETTSQQTDTLLMANLLSFYEKQSLFANRSSEIRPYLLEQPLWLFVGNRVNTLGSDVLTLTRFFHRTLSDARWATETIERLLDGDSGLTDALGTDVLKDRYPYLRDVGSPDPSVVYRDILARTFHTATGGGLSIFDIRRSKHELGLKASGSGDYFGLIYIGNTSGFKRMVEDAEPGIMVEDDAISGSIFAEIGEPGTTIETLIGSRKFIEGWNSWRVSNMGLLNIGTNEGPQIIQLFGRGVRLRGRGTTLKRSSALQADNGHPSHIRLLETLNIFAIRANYMAAFMSYLQREGVPAGSVFDMPLFIRPSREFFDKGLVIPRMDEERDFNSETEAMLEFDSEMQPVYIDVSARVQSLSSDESSIDEASASSGIDTVIPYESLNLIDWDKVYLSLIQYKEQKGMDNLVVRPSSLKSIMVAGSDAYHLVADETLRKPGTYEEWMRLNDTVTGILRQYADKLYRRSRERWESNHMVYKQLDETDTNFSFNDIHDDGGGSYIVSVPASEQELIQEIESLIADCVALYKTEDGALRRIHFDRHLYQPLLLENGGKRLRMSPPGLTASEHKFVSDLKDYWHENRDDGLSDAEIFLLRNQGKGMGVGFFENSGFYPDFIMWIKSGDGQRIVFVEPHGMIHEDAPEYSDKVQLYKRLRDLSVAMSERSGVDDVTLDSFVVSATPHRILRRKFQGDWSRNEFANEHILFPDRDREYDYLSMILGNDA